MVSEISQLNSNTNSINFSAMKNRQEEMFTKIDTNNDGSIDKAEFTAFGQQMAQKIGKADKSEEIFAQMDTDGDGKITKAEFEAFHEKMKSRMISMIAAKAGESDKFEGIFTQMDTDGDGKVSAAEFKAFDEKMKSGTMSEMMAKANSDSGVSNGSISTLLGTLNQNDDGSSVLYSTSIQQYANAFQNNTQPVLDLVG